MLAITQDLPDMLSGEKLDDRERMTMNNILGLRLQGPTTDLSSRGSILFRQPPLRRAGRVTGIALLAR